MAYAAGPHELPGVRLEDPDARGLVLEELSQRVCPSLPPDCRFIRWDLMTEAWRDSRGQSLARPLQELRMNASTRGRSLRKATAEITCPDTMVVELSGGREAILGRMDARTRYSLRLAERRGTRVEERGEEGIGRFHLLFAETALRQDLRLYTESVYRDLFRSARRHGLDLRLYLATYQGKEAPSWRWTGPRPGTSSPLRPRACGRRRVRAPSFATPSSRPGRPAVNEWTSLASDRKGTGSTPSRDSPSSSRALEAGG
jgi:hypothetical protein